MEKQKSIWSKAWGVYRKTGKVYDKFVIVLLVLMIGLLIIYLIFPVSNNTQVQVKEVDRSEKLINCIQTSDSNLQNVTTSAIKPVKEISLINFETEVIANEFKKNVVPPINRPQFWLYEKLGGCFSDDELVFVVKYNNEIRLYPLAILEYHIVVNDFFGSVPVAVVYTPISGIYRAYITNIKGDMFTMGHSGALYKNTDLLVDFQSDTLWNSMTGKAVLGLMTGAQLQEVEIRKMTYGAAKEEFPEAEILSFQTGFRRTYGIDPFKSYKATNLVYQEPKFTYTGSEAKEMVLAFTYQNAQYAVLTSKVNEKEPYRGKVLDQDLKIVLKNGEYFAYLGKGEDSRINTEEIYYFVWYDYYPNTKLLD